MVVIMITPRQIRAARALLGWSQRQLADKAIVSLNAVTRLEKGKVDPALSAIRRLALALDLGLGKLVEELPPERTLSRDEMDQLARGAWRPGTAKARELPETRILASMIQERRKALGRTSATITRRQPGAKTAQVNASRWLRASLGQKQWEALLRRIDKLAATTEVD